MMKKFLKSRKVNNKGVTLTELIVTFALLALFMVAATRIITYTVNIYYAIRGNAYGLEVSNMISNKLVGQIEGARASLTPKVDRDGSEIESLTFIDSTGSKVTVTAKNGVSSDVGTYIDIYYDAVTEGSVPYDAVDWTFDSKAYMGYNVSTLKFVDPGDDYPDNVMKMILGLESQKYGEYVTSYYIKCVNVEKIDF